MYQEVWMCDWAESVANTHPIVEPKDPEGLGYVFNNFLLTLLLYHPLLLPILLLLLNNLLQLYFIILNQSDVSIGWGQKVTILFYMNKIPTPYFFHHFLQPSGTVYRI